MPICDFPTLLIRDRYENSLSHSQNPPKHLPEINNSVKKIGQIFLGFMNLSQKSI
jgi:hypothetical protein